MINAVFAYLGRFFSLSLSRSGSGYAAEYGFSQSSILPLFPYS